MRVVAALEFSAGVQRGEDDLQRRLFELGHLVDRDAAAVVLDRDGARALVQRDLDARGKAVDRLVDRVVEDLPEQVVVAGRTCAADIHGRPLANRIEPFEDGDVAGGVVA